MQDLRAISMFYGIIIRMYTDDAIKTPHFRVSYRGYNAVFEKNPRFFPSTMDN